jgi:hypothetical protein
MLPPSAGSKNKPRKKLAQSRWQTNGYALKLEVMISSEKLVGFQRTKQHYNPEDIILSYPSKMWGLESKLGPLATSVYVPAPGDCEDGEFSEMKIGRGNRSTRRKPAPMPIFPPQIPLDKTWARTQAAGFPPRRPG